MLKIYLLQLIPTEAVELPVEKLTVNLHGMLYHQLPHGIADAWHDAPVSPFTLFTFSHHNTWHAIIKVMTQEAIRVFDNLLVENPTPQFVLRSAKLVPIEVRVLSTKECTLQQLNQPSSISPTKVRLHFQSPTTFKVKGKYQLYPELRLIWQSLLMKYRWLADGEFESDEVLLAALVEATHITTSQIKNRYAVVHKSGIKGFVGSVDIAIDATEEVQQLLHQLLQLVEFTSIGIKGALGMGHIHVEYLA
ncbi:CRISPR system precrRNA processing endoribonuclease RAMP protein Cas6 [Aerococcaceae bacterium NML130460]|nr:CRISPR system precrRNA processing endoribonuclease RAMP protein Cas6 [Aerococcaceae bacterium NML130460]